MEDVGDSDRQLMGGLGYKTLIGRLSELLRKQSEISGWCTVEKQAIENSRLNTS